MDHFAKIDELFERVIMTPGIHHRLAVNAPAVRSMRYKIRRGLHISYDHKVRTIQKSGTWTDHARWTDQDLVDLVTFTIHTSGQAREFGAAYVIEKWKRKR